MTRSALALMSLLASTVACGQTDPAITAKVKTQLAADELVKARNITVDTESGVVTLTGTVNSSPEETKALEIARTTEGVSDVVDMLSIIPEAGATGTSGRFGDIPGPIMDSGLTAEIKARFLADRTVKGLTIDVDTSDRVVTLSGTVSSQAEKDRAVEIARGVEQVSGVEDRLIVQSGR